MIIWFIGQQTLADGQSIMRRYDAWGQVRAESAFGVELKQDSGFVVFIGARLSVDSVVYSSVATSLQLNATGTVLDTSMIFQTCCATYVGWANVGFPLEGGGYGVAGCNMDTAGTINPVLYFADSSGGLIAAHVYGSVGEEWIGRQGKETRDGGYVICGETTSSGTSVDGFLLKIDSAHVQEWVQTYGQTNKSEYLVTVDLAPGGGYYLGGQRAITASNYDQWVLRVDSNGQVIWENDFGTPYSDPNAQITSTADGNLVFATSWADSVNDFYRLGLAKVDSTGSLTWSQTYDGVALDAILFTTNEITPSGDLIAAGQSYRPGYLQGVLLRTSATGDSLWLRYYHYYDSLITQGEGLFKDVIPTFDHGFIAVGAAYGSDNPNDPLVYGQDTWVVKVDSMGCLVPGCHLITGLQSQVTNLRDALTVAPNPASEVARLSWELPQTLVGSAQLTVVSAAGQLVGTVPLVLAVQSHALDVSSYPAGLYHLHLVVDGQWVSGCKMVVE